MNHVAPGTLTWDRYWNLTTAQLVALDAEVTDLVNDRKG